MLWASPHAGFLESDWLSTTQVEKTGISNRIQIFLSWKRKKNCVSLDVCRIDVNLFFPPYAKMKSSCWEQDVHGREGEEEEEGLSCYFTQPCLQPFFFFFTALADHEDSGHFWQTTNTSKDGQKQRNSLLVWSGIHSFILARSAPWTHDCWTMFAPHVWSSCLTPTVLSYNRIY